MKNTQKILATVTAAVLSVSAFSTLTLADDAIKILVDGTELNIPAGDTRPFIEDNRTLVPMRAIFEALGAEVKWDNDAERVTAHEPEKNITVVLDIGSKNMLVNDEKVEIDVPAKVVNNRTVVPVRAIAEGMKCSVDWDSATKTVIVEKEEKNSISVYGGIWHDTVNEGVTYSSEGTDDPNVLEVTVTRKDSDTKMTVWTMKSTYDAETGILTYKNGKKTEQTFNDKGLENEKVIWENGEGTFQFARGVLIYWSDTQDDAFAAKCRFMNEFEEDDEETRGTIQALANKVWKATDKTSKVVKYFLFSDDMSGKIINDNGTGVPFSWEANGADVMLHIGGADDNSILIPFANDDGTYTMTIESESSSQTYTFELVKDADFATFDIEK